MKQVLQAAAGSTIVRDVPPPANPRQNVLVQTEYSIVSSGTERAVVQAAQKPLVRRVAERPELALKVVQKVRRDGIDRTRELIRENVSAEGVIGYSCAGTVLAVGSAVTGVAVGDRVACGGAGHANHAELVSVPGNLCVKVPEGVSMSAAALTTIASVALHGFRLAGVTLGERVAVIGCGLVGQIACRLAAASGAAVIALDVDAARTELARSSGADAAIVVETGAAEAVRAATQGLGVDAALVMAAASTSDPLQLAAEICRDRGAVVLVGDVPVNMPRSALYDKELSFRVSRSYGPGRYDHEYEQRGHDYPVGYVRWTERRNMECVLDLQSRGRLVLGDLISDYIPITEADSAYRRLTGPIEQRPRGAIAFSYRANAAAPSHPPVRPLTKLARGPRVGLIGPGNFALSALVPALRRSGAELVAVAGGSGVRAEASTRRAGFARAEASPETLIAADDIDAVVIATRHGSHAELTQAALAAGKHVFCEKPLATDSEALSAVLEAAEQAGRVLAVGFNRRFAPQIIRIREFLSQIPGPGAGVYRVSAGRVPSSSWVHDLDDGGGRIIGECCHFLDTLVSVFGETIATVDAAGYGDLRLPAQANDNVVITLQFTRGSVATVAYVAEGASAVPKERLELFRGERTAILEDYHSTVLYDGRRRTEAREKAQDKGHLPEVQAFLGAVRDGAHPVALDQIRNVHEACFAAVDSLTHGARVTLDPRRSDTPAATD